MTRPYEKSIVNYLFLMLYNHKFPNEEFELTANSLGAHVETHGGLILRAHSELTR